jgi:YHS domain-containing protein
MIRTVLYLLVAIFLLTFLRYVIGAITRGFADLLHPQRPSQPAGPARQTETVGELKKDPVCGTYVSAATSVRSTFRGEVLYFCSAACRDKFKST